MAAEVGFGVVRNKLDFLSSRTGLLNNTPYLFHKDSAEGRDSRTSDH